MTKTNPLSNTLYYHYSPTYRYAVGLEAVKDKFLKQNYSNLRVTYLLNRKNTATSQFNLYIHSGISPDKSANYFYGILGDWETRRWFAGFDVTRAHTAPADFSEYGIQLGVTPYIGDYGDVHTWLIAKSKRNTINNEWDSYPVLKLFKGSTLLEVGYSHKSDWDTHLMYRF